MLMFLCYFLDHLEDAAVLSFNCIAVDSSLQTMRQPKEKQSNNRPEFLAHQNLARQNLTHEFFANFTLLLVMLHVGGVVVSSFLEGENLIHAMLHGRKRWHDDALDR